jgi:hypothetical protein
MRWGCGCCCGFDVAIERSGWWYPDVGDGDQIRLVRQMSYMWERRYWTTESEQELGIP